MQAHRTIEDLPAHVLQIANLNQKQPKRKFLVPMAKNTKSKNPNSENYEHA
jgi:hypothetical protein